MENLIETAKGYLGPRVIEEAAPLAKESPATTGRALDAAVPAFVGALAGEASSTPGAERLLRVLDEAGFVGSMESVAERLRGATGEETVTLGEGLLHRALGGRAGAVVDEAARSTGVAPSTMGTLMDVAAPIVLGLLGSEIHARGLDAEGLTSFLAQQRITAPTVVQEPVAAPRTVTAPPPRRVEPVVDASPSGVSSLRTLWPILLVPLVALAIVLPRRHMAPPVTPEAAHGMAALGVGVAPTEPPGADAVPRGSGATGADVERYLAGSGDAPSRRFVFSDLRFDFGTTNLTPSSLPTLDALAAALVAHPNAKVLLEGHTDAIGAPVANERLSIQRAEAIKRALVARGVDADHVETQGFGQDRPAASNETPQGRAQNRRIEVVVTR